MPAKKRTPPPAERLARPAEVLQIYRISEATLWRWAKSRPAFPKARRQGPNHTVFSLDELDAFFAAEAAKRA
jgi:predicted DNA-binding transcriptional regulator AlpA